MGKRNAIVTSFMVAIILLMGLKARAQRTIEFFEPDYDSSYALHSVLFQNLSNRPEYPTHYNQFFSNTANEKKIKKIEKSVITEFSKVVENIFFNFNGYVVSRTMKYYYRQGQTDSFISGNNIEEKYKYSCKRDNRIISLHVSSGDTSYIFKYKFSKLNLTEKYVGDYMYMYEYDSGRMSSIYYKKAEKPLYKISYYKYFSALHSYPKYSIIDEFLSENGATYNNKTATGNISYISGNDVNNYIFFLLAHI